MANEVTKQETTALVPSREFKRPSALEIMFDERMFAQASRVANMMAGARGIVPRHLVGCPEACFAVVVTAMTTGLNPYAVANATYNVHGKVGYEGKLVIAILEASGRFENDKIIFEHFGPWENVRGKFERALSKSKDEEGNDKYYPKMKWGAADAKGCGVKVRARVRGESEDRTYELMLDQCFPLNSTLWATQPEQQICYRAARGFANLAAPSILMGIPADDDPLSMAGDNAIDVTEPALQIAQPTHPHIVEGKREMYQVVTAEGEVVEFAGLDHAIAALTKIIDGSARQSPKALDTAWENNLPFINNLGRADNEDIHELYEQLKAKLANPAAQAPQDSTAPAAEPHQEQQTTAAQSVARGPAAKSQAQNRHEHDAFWDGESLMVPAPQTSPKNTAPHWKIWPLVIGPRIRQAWTVQLLDELAKDNVGQMEFYEQACGAEEAKQIKDAFGDRRGELRSQD